MCGDYWSFIQNWPSPLPPLALSLKVAFSEVKSIYFRGTTIIRWASLVARNRYIAVLLLPVLKPDIVITIKEFPYAFSLFFGWVFFIPASTSSSKYACIWNTLKIAYVSNILPSSSSRYSPNPIKTLLIWILMMVSPYKLAHVLVIHKSRPKIAVRRETNAAVVLSWLYMYSSVVAVSEPATVANDFLSHFDMICSSLMEWLHKIKQQK